MHREATHNMMNYILFAVRLWSQPEEADNGLESYVRHCISLDNVNWFPIGVVSVVNADGSSMSEHIEHTHASQLASSDAAANRSFLHAPQSTALSHSISVGAADASGGAAPSEMHMDSSKAMMEKLGRLQDQMSALLGHDKGIKTNEGSENSDDADMSDASDADLDSDVNETLEKLTNESQTSAVLRPSKIMQVHRKSKRKEKKIVHVKSSDSAQENIQSDATQPVTSPPISSSAAVMHQSADMSKTLETMEKMNSSLDEMAKRLKSLTRRFDAREARDKKLREKERIRSEALTPRSRMRYENDVSWLAARQAALQDSVISQQSGMVRSVPGFPDEDFDEDFAGDRDHRRVPSTAEKDSNAVTMTMTTTSPLRPKTASALSERLQAALGYDRDSFGRRQFSRPKSALPGAAGSQLMIPALAGEAVAASVKHDNDGKEPVRSSGGDKRLAGPSIDMVLAEPVKLRAAIARKPGWANEPATTD